MDAPWCPFCGTRHPDADSCPECFEASGSERPGWRVTVETERGIEAYGVLVAPAAGRWRARILTFPNILWVVPGGGVSLKFLSATPQGAEREAIAYIERHCERRGVLRRDQLVPLEMLPLRGEAPQRLPSLIADFTSPRKVRSLQARFGSTTPTLEAFTYNVSETGLFLATSHPLDGGVPVRVQVDLDEVPVALRGLVIWNRRRPESGRPAGMGIQLVQPPGPYVRFVRSLP